MITFILFVSACDTNQEVTLQGEDKVAILAKKLVKDVAFLELYSVLLTKDETELSAGNFRKAAENVSQSDYMK